MNAIPFDMNYRSLIPRLAISLVVLGSLAWLLPAIRPTVLSNFPAYETSINLGLIFGWFLVYFGCACAMFGPIRQKIYELAVPTHASPNKADLETMGIAGTVSLITLIGTGLIILLLLVDYLGHNVVVPFTGTKEYLGTFGDFFGGVLNPVLTFFTFIALAITLVLQRIQLREAKEQAAEAGQLSRLQTFETTFFNLLNLHATTVEHLAFNPNDVFVAIEEEEDDERRERRSANKQTDPNERQGSPRQKPVSILASLAALKEQRREKEARRSKGADQIVRPRAEGRAVFSAVLHTMQELKSDEAKDYKSPEDVYKTIQTRNNYVLGHYFRNLYQILAFIDKHFPQPGASTKETNTPKRYSNILRAQLSANELTLLYYNCQGILVDDGEFRRLLIKYEMLEHIPLRYSPDKECLIVPGYKFEIRTEILEYARHVKTDEDSSWQPGAFGKNGEVKSFLDDLNQRPKLKELDTERLAQLLNRSTGSDSNAAG